MKKTMVSLVAAAALTTGAFAADKGIDIVTNGQAVVYYQTTDTNAANDKGFFDQDNSSANVGIQLDLSADLKNNFTFGSQLTYLGTAGLEKNLVDSVMQTGGTTVQGSTTDDIALTKIFVAKKIANTTVKIGRQELPKSLSPLAYTESWNVFKNTFDAIVAINTDIPNTTLVGAYVSGSTAHSLGSTADIANSVDKGVYMITAQTTAIPMTTFTASYYHLSNVDAVSALGLTDIGEVRNTATNALVTAGLAAGDLMVGADAIWLDAQIAPKDAPMGLHAGLQFGNIDHDGANAEDTTAYGIKVGAKAGAISGYLAYTDVDDGDLAARNYGTGDKTPLFTQMVLTEDSVSRDAEAVVAAVSYNAGEMGNFMLRYGMVDAGDTNQVYKTGLVADAVTGNSTNTFTHILEDETELDLIYTVSAGGVDYFAAYVMRERDFRNLQTNVSSTDDFDVIRVWARYNF